MLKILTIIQDRKSNLFSFNVLWIGTSSVLLSTQDLSILFNALYDFVHVIVLYLKYQERLPIVQMKTSEERTSLIMYYKRMNIPQT
jgi:hypothetical protein